jgi:hypothetical protein
VVVAFLVEQSFTRRGLLTVAHLLGPFSKALVVEAGSQAEPPPKAGSSDAEWLPDYEVAAVRVRYLGTPVETVSFEEAARIERRLVARIGGGE